MCLSGGEGGGGVATGGFENLILGREGGGNGFWLVNFWDNIPYGAPNLRHNLRRHRLSSRRRLRAP